MPPVPPDRSGAAGLPHEISYYALPQRIAAPGPAYLSEKFLLERARLQKLTSYTELNATLVRRTGLPGFDFSRAVDPILGRLR